MTRACAGALSLTRVFVPALRVAPARPTGARLELAGQALGTAWSVRGYTAGTDGAALRRAVARELECVEREMSQWRGDSVLSRFNHAAAGSVHTLPAGFGAVMACALAVAAETRGAFDPALGALTELWGFGAAPTPAVAPDDRAVEAARRGSGWRRLHFDAGTRRLTQPGGAWLDLSGIAKGHAVDRVADLLRALGLGSFLVEIGGELRGEGIKADGQPWWVEIEAPPAARYRPARVALHGLAIATSGDLLRAHTLDPASGRPLQDGPAAVTVLHPVCMWADAYATALMVLGVEAGIALADRLGLCASFALRTPAGTVERCSAAFQRQLA